jgi:hypothetical protein
VYAGRSGGSASVGVADEGARSRAHVERNLSLEGMTRATLDVYAAVLGE